MKQIAIAIVFLLAGACIGLLIGVKLSVHPQKLTVKTVRYIGNNEYKVKTNRGIITTLSRFEPESVIEVSYYCPPINDTLNN